VNPVQGMANEAAALPVTRAGKAASVLSLFTSGGTLICCALPALLVSLGAGAALAGLVSAVPGIVWMSENKGLTFGVAGLMLAAAGWLQWRARFEPCPIDPALAATCMRTRRISRNIYLFSVVMTLVGAFFAFIAPALMG
jgi:hypothetical protein